MKGRRSMEKRHVKWYKVAKVSKKMNKHMFDGENIDLAQVIKDVNENFTLLFKSTISQYENLHRKFYVFYDPDLLRLRKALGFYIPFSRCMLKRCVEEGGVINRSLIDILNDIESHFVDLLKLCTSLLSQGQLYSEKSELRRMSYYFGRDSEIVSRMSNAYVAVFSTESSPQPTTGFMHSYASMVEFLDQVLEDLEECDMEDTNIKHSVEKSKFLREYIQFTNEYWMSGQSSNEFLNSVEAVAESAACYLFLKKHGKFSSVEQYLQIKNRLKSKMSVGVLKALVLMKFQDSAELPPLTDGLLKGYVDCVQENLTELINDELTTQVKNQFEDLHKDLEFLAGSILSHPAELEKLSDIRPRFQTLVGNVGSLVFSSLNEETRVKARTEMSIEIPSLLEMADLLKGLIIHTLTDLLFITFGRIGGDSPQTNQLGFLNFLIDNLRDLKDSTFSFQTYEAGGFQTIHEGLVLLRSFLQKLTGNGNTTADDEESKDLSNRISCVAYEAEHLINSYVAKPIPDCCRFRWFSYFEQQVKLIKDTFADISEKKSANDIDNIDTNGVGSSKSPISLRSLALVPTSDVVVGFDAEMESIKERLVSDLRKLDVVSIVGMGGLGKTTLAKKVYEDLSIVDHFQFRAWCCVSQEYNKKELLLKLLGSIVEVTDLICRKSDGDLSVMLHKQLTGRRYLIVMDDIWGMDSLKDLKRYFPDNSNGSRIMLTSRNRLEDYSDPLELRFLTDDESWDLLKHKVYQKEEECPLGLWQVGKKIAEKCRGLPLAIVVVSGILAKTEKKHDFWEQVSGNLSTYVAGDTEGQVIAALELSYKFLPDHLKPLFLYLGAFPEDKEIATNKLTWLWIADGFVKKTDNLLISLELQAELNLMDLIDRSLVMIARRRSDGRVRSCSVHDMLRDLCLRKAKEENFMRQMNVHNELPDPLTYERRLSISLNRIYREHPLSPQRPFITCEGLPMLPLPHPLTSFLFFNMNKSHSLSEEAIKSVFRGFRLLRILHSESITVETNLFTDHVVPLVHLRYVSFRTNWNLIPSSISKLWNLETLIIKGLRGEIVVPAEILNMVKLRHLHVNDRADFKDALIESSSKLQNLQTLSTPSVCDEEEKKLIQRVPNLQKLRCIFVESRDFYRNYYQLPQLESLNQLESLKMLRYGSMPHSGEFGLPSTLKKLTLSKFRLQWSEISSFQKLQNLEVLKLRGGAVEGAVWDTGDGKFPKLKFLKLEALNIKQWIVSADNFPCLKKLVVKNCKQLEEIPSSVGDFYSLEKIEVAWCSASAARSAKLIQEEQKDVGNELLKVQVYMSSRPGNGDEIVKPHIMHLFERPAPKC